MIIAGVDPGLSGAVALIDTQGNVVVYDMPTLALQRGGKNKREIDARALAFILSGQGGVVPIDHVFVEQVGAMPGQGVSSMFAMGKGLGIVIGILAARALPYTLVSSMRWKRALAVPKEKDGARARASQLMPIGAVKWPLVKHHGRAEAALIAYYGLTHRRNDGQIADVA